MEKTTKSKGTFRAAALSMIIDILHRRGGDIGTGDKLQSFGKVETGDDEVSGRSWERNPRESGVRRLSVNDGILITVMTKNYYNNISWSTSISGQWVARPDTNVVTVLVTDIKTLDVEFNVNTVPFCADVEEFASDVDESWEGVSGHPY